MLKTHTQEGALSHGPDHLLTHGAITAGMRGICRGEIKRSCLSASGRNAKTAQGQKCYTPRQAEGAQGRVWGFLQRGRDAARHMAAPSRWYTRLIALVGMVGEVLMQDCCDIHSTDLPNGVWRRRKAHIASLHKLVQRCV